METALKMGLTPEDDFILRVVQLSELLAIRHCVFLMGPTGSGRSECYKVLAKAMQTGTDKPVNTYLEVNNRKKVSVKCLSLTCILPQRCILSDSALTWVCVESGMTLLLLITRVLGMLCLNVDDNAFR